MQNSASPAARYALLDEIRGADLISMMCYHTVWDTVYIFGVSAGWYAALPGRLWQQSICWVFILLSGFCAPLGRRTLRRGAVVFAAGALVTAVTLIFMPADAVWFGVLTLLGSAMLLTGLLGGLLRRVPPAVGLTASTALFALGYNAAAGYIGLGAFKFWLPAALYSNYFTAYFGFYPAYFYSTDYFPLVPWVFLFWCGYYLHLLLGRGRFGPLRCSVCAPLGRLGRHSLLIYMLHQPVIYGALAAVFAVRKMF